MDCIIITFAEYLASFSTITLAVYMGFISILVLDSTKTDQNLKTNIKNDFGPYLLASIVLIFVIVSFFPPDYRWICFLIWLIWITYRCFSSE
jgi:hypothetical protein